MEIGSFEFIYWKSVSMILFEYVFIKASGSDHMDVPKELRTTIFCRALTGFIGMSGLFTGIQLTSMSKAVVLFNVNPIFVAIFARIFLGEKISYFDWVAIVLAFFGIVLL